MIKQRTTVYLRSDLIKLLKLRAIRTNQSMSEYINQVVSQDLLEEEKDLVDIKKKLDEPTIPFKELLKKLKIDGKI